MKLKSATQMSLLVVLLTWSLQGLASIAILCPPVNLVTKAWQKMDDAIPDVSRTYIVTTSEPAFSTEDGDWNIRTIIPARNQQDAIKLAQLTVRDASALMTPTAIKVFNSYGCIYFSGRAFVYALMKAPE